MLNDDEVLDATDTYKLGELILWPDRQEAREHFKERTLAWWGEYFGHPHHPEKGYCTACGRGGSCIFDVFAEGIEMAVAEALAGAGLLRSVQHELCPRHDKDEPHGRHIYRTDYEPHEWAVCEYVTTFAYWTEPWDKGEVIHIWNAFLDYEVGVTQTHIDHPDDTVEAMASDYIRVKFDCAKDTFVLRHEPDFRPPTPEEET